MRQDAGEIVYLTPGECSDNEMVLSVTYVQAIRPSAEFRAVASTSHVTVSERRGPTTGSQIEAAETLRRKFRAGERVTSIETSVCASFQGVRSRSADTNAQRARVTAVTD